jgi:hypothetical protein
MWELSLERKPRGPKVWVTQRPSLEASQTRETVPSSEAGGPDLERLSDFITLYSAFMVFRAAFVQMDSRAISPCFACFV